MTRMQATSVTLVVVLPLWGACAFDGERTQSEQQRTEVYTTATSGGGGAPPCTETATECIDIESEKDISFIAVLAEVCPGATVELELFYPDMTPVNVTPYPHGQGKPCEKAGLSIDPAALKFDGLTEDHYVLCVTYDGVASIGDVLVTAKAGRACWEESLYGECESCPPPNGSGGGGGAPPNGSGGATGEGGEGGCRYRSARYADEIQ